MVLIALLVCLIPTTIGGLLSAIGIAGMDRVLQRNVLATSGRAVEAAGDVDTLLLDKTGTITLGNRQASEIVAAPGVDRSGRVPARRTTPRWPTRRPRAARSCSSPARTPALRAAGAQRRRRAAGGATVVPFSAYTRMSGVDFADGRQLRKGAPDAVRAWVSANARRRRARSPPP